MPHSLSWHKICIFAAVTPRHLKVSAASHLLMPQHWVRCDEVTQECSITMHCASPFKRFVVHLVQSPLAAGRHPPLGGAPLLVSQLPLRALVAEDLHLRRITESSSDSRTQTESQNPDLAVAAVDAGAAHLRPGVVIRVDLDVQWKTFHSFLCTEI